MRNLVSDLYNQLLLLYDAARNRNIVVFNVRNNVFGSIYNQVFHGTTTPEPDDLEGMFDTARNRLFDYLTEGIVPEEDKEEYLEEIFNSIREFGRNIQFY